MLIAYTAKTKDPQRKPQEITGTMEIPDFTDRVAEYKHVHLAVRDKHDWYYMVSYQEVKPS